MVVSPGDCLLSVCTNDERSIVAELWRIAQRPTFQSGPGNGTFQVCLPVEMCLGFHTDSFISYDNTPSYTNQSNWLTAGAYMTNRKAYLQSVYEGLGQTLSFFMRQIPSTFVPELDLEALRGAISIESEDGGRISPESWPHRPDSATMGKRDQASRAWHAWSESQKRFIPSLAQQSTFLVRLHVL